MNENSSILIWRKINFTDVAGDKLKCLKANLCVSQMLPFHLIKQKCSMQVNQKSLNTIKNQICMRSKDMISVLNAHICSFLNKSSHL